MAKTAIATQQTAWNCRWSRPGFQLLVVDEPRQPESLWICIRHGRRRGVTDEQCETCPHWELDDTPED